MVWLRKYGTLDWSQPNNNNLPRQKETPSQKIKRLERDRSDEKLKNKLLNAIVDVTDEQFGTSMRKKFLSQESAASSTKSD